MARTWVTDARDFLDDRDVEPPASSRDRPSVFNDDAQEPAPTEAETHAITDP